YHRLPTVSYDYDFGPRDVIEDGESGFVVPVGDVEALADRLRALVADADLRERFGRRARVIFDERFAADAVVSQYAELVGPAPGRAVDLADVFATEGGEPVRGGDITHRVKRLGTRRVHQLLVRSR